MLPGAVPRSLAGSRVGALVGALPGAPLPSPRPAHPPRRPAAALRAGARTALVMAAMIALLGAGGWLVAGARGLAPMLALGLALDVAAYVGSDRLALRAHRARELPAGELPRLRAAVERLAARAGVPPPRLYLIPSDHANAFATGRGPGHASLAVTEGLVASLDDRELEGVLAHELAHVAGRDVLVASVAAGLAGAIAAVGYALRWGLLLGDRRDRARRGGGATALAWLVVAPVVALLLQLALSRGREFRADEAGARLTGDPDGLADALARIDARDARHPYDRVDPATSHLFIHDPARRAGRRGAAAWLAALLSTHPPTAARIARLRRLRADGATWG